MKKIILTALVAITLGITAFAGPNSVNSKVANHFTSHYAKAQNVSWKVDNQFAKASFLIENEKVEVFYDTDGEMIGTSKNISFDKLPKAAIEKLTTEYTFPEFQIKECIEFVNADKEKNYYVSFASPSGTIALEITKYGYVRLFSKLS